MKEGGLALVARLRPQTLIAHSDGRAVRPGCCGTGGLVVVGIGGASGGRWSTHSRASKAARKSKVFGGA